MKRILISLLALAMLAGCATAAAESLPTLPLDAPQKPAPPVNSGTPANASPSINRPRPDNGKLMRSEVNVEAVELKVMESSPVQYSIVLRGNLPTPCHQIRVVFLQTEPNETNKIKIEVYALSKPDAACIQVIQPFEQTVDLGSFPAGHYTVWVNGMQAAEFDA